ncbi:MAG: hypothetical protein Kow00121_58060 [Elainellaceae cyanobacterium]
MRRIVVLLMICGICLRFINLDHKVYWYDETFTSLRSAGYSEAEVVQHFAQSSVVSLAELQAFQHPVANRGLSDTLNSLAIEDTQHPPLYYMLAHVWMRKVGSSTTAMRLLPALLSLLTFPAMYWLCWELAEAWPNLRSAKFRAQVGWIGTGLLAVSPFHLLYAQESRQYSLWSATCLLTTAALLQAIRRRTTLSWIIYALALTTSLYTFLFSVLMAIAHGIYLLLLPKIRLTKTLAAYLLASCAAWSAFSPWAWQVWSRLDQAQKVTGWTAKPQPIVNLAVSWASLLGRLFYDCGDQVWHRGIQVGFLVVMGIAFYDLCRRTPFSVWGVIVTLTGVPALALILPDLILGGLRSTFPRYLIPALLGIQVAVAYWLAMRLGDGIRIGKPQQWRWLVLTVFSAGLVSGLTIISAPIWWSKTLNQELPTIAAVINQADRPLVLSDAETGDLLALSHQLHGDVKLLIRPRCYTCTIKSAEEINPDLSQIPDGYSHVFLFHPRSSLQWRRSLQQQPYHFAPSLSAKAGLWQL